VDIICLVYFKLLMALESAIESSPMFDLHEVGQADRNRDFVLRVKYFIGCEIWIKPQHDAILSVRCGIVYSVVKTNSPIKWKRLR